MFVRPVLPAEGSHRESALFLFRDQITPELASLFLIPRHDASMGHPSRLAKWCSRDGYEPAWPCLALLEHGQLFSKEKIFGQ